MRMWLQEEWVPDSEDLDNQATNRPRRANAAYSLRASQRGRHVYNTRASGNRTLLHERYMFFYVCARVYVLFYVCVCVLCVSFLPVLLGKAQYTTLLVHQRLHTMIISQHLLRAET